MSEWLDQLAVVGTAGTVGFFELIGNGGGLTKSSYGLCIVQSYNDNRIGQTIPYCCEVIL